jgi:hypothetical protein
VNTLQALFILLLVAYIGGFLMGGRGIRGLGLPSGSEWLVLGLVAGPGALGLVSGSEVATFAPLALLATGWIALLVGLAFGIHGERRIGAAGMALGVLSGLVGFAGVAGAVWAVLEFVPAASAAFPATGDRALLVVGIGVSLADTSRHAVRWAVERLGARGPLLDRVADVSLSDDVVPIAIVSLLLSLDTSRGVPALPGVGLVLGTVLGLACALLLGRTLRTASFWGLLFGFSLLATGVAEQLDLSAISTGFPLGLALALASPLRRQARAMAQGVEGAVILPALFLAGARATMLTGPSLWIAGAALAARLVAAILSGGLVAATSSSARRGGGALALTFFPVGPLGIAIALAVNVRYPGAPGDLVLATTVATAIAGEFVGPPALRRALRRAGELGAQTDPSAAVAGPAREGST